MAVKCPHPNCGGSVEREPNGRYPKRCPHCGKLLNAAVQPVVQAAAKKTTAKAVGARLPTNGERGAASERAEPSNDDPFGIRERVSTVPLTGSSTQQEPAAVGPFGAAPTPMLVKLPYGKKPSKGAAVVPWILGILVLGGVSAGGIYFAQKYSEEQAAKAKIKAPATTKYTNPGRNYNFEPPTADWLASDSVKKVEKVDLAFVRGDYNARILVSSGEAMTNVPTLAQLADAVLKDWQTEMPELTEVPRTDDTLAGRPALKLTGLLKSGRITEMREAYVMFAEGISYRLVFGAPEENFRALSGDFGVAKRNFELLRSRPEWREHVVGTSSLVPFASKKFPYQVRTPKGWRENPEIETGSRLTDLTLIDPEKLATLIVTPRGTSDADLFEKSYMDRLKAQNSERVTLHARETKLRVGKYPAQRLYLVVDGVDNIKYFLVSTFVKVDAMIYLIECRAPNEHVADYKPVFEKIVATFEILPKPAGVPDGDVATTEPKSKADDDDTPKKSSSVKKAKLPEGDSEKPAAKKTKDDADDEKPKATKPAKPDSEKKSVKPAKRKSLDDLDDEMPAEPKSKAKKADAKEKSKSDDSDESKPKRADADDKPKSAKEKASDKPDAADKESDGKKPKEKEPAGKTKPAKRKSLDDLD